MEVPSHSKNEFVSSRGREAEDGKGILTIVKGTGEEDLFVRKVVLNLREVVQGTGFDRCAHDFFYLNMVNASFLLSFASKKSSCSPFGLMTIFMM